MQPTIKIKENQTCPIENKTLKTLIDEQEARPLCSHAFYLGALAIHPTNERTFYDAKALTTHCVAKKAFFPPENSQSFHTVDFFVRKKQERGILHIATFTEKQL